MASMCMLYGEEARTMEYVGKEIEQHAHSFIPARESRKRGTMEEGGQPMESFEQCTLCTLPYLTYVSVVHLTNQPPNQPNQPSTSRLQTHARGNKPKRKKKTKRKKEEKKSLAYHDYDNDDSKNHELQ